MKAVSQKRLRNLHNWLGVFFAPGILLFAVSGIFQTLGLHENGPGRQPALPFIGLLASLHKEGEATLSKRRPPPAGAQIKPAGPSPEHDHDEGLSPFKIYALLLSASLTASTVMGVAIAITNRAARRRTGVLLAAGCVLPVLLCLL
jgi:hypothetical protein